MQGRNIQQGYTIIELVITIVVFSILAVGIAGFIASSSSGYIATGNRNQLSSAGRIAVDKLTMELRNALPASVRISNVVAATTAARSSGDQCLEFIPVIAASTYIDAPFQPAADNFSMVEAVPDLTSENGLYAIIYPDKSSQIYAEPVPNKGPRKAVISVVHNADDTDQVTLVGNHRFQKRSKVNRIFFTRQPVSYCVKADRLYRYENYGFSTTQLLPVDNNGSCGAANCLPATTPQRSLVASNINNSALNSPGNSAFNQLSASRTRNAVVQLQLDFSRSGDSVIINHEVLLQSTP